MRSLLNAVSFLVLIMAYRDSLLQYCTNADESFVLDCDTIQDRAVSDGHVAAYGASYALVTRSCFHRPDQHPVL